VLFNRADYDGVAGYVEDHAAGGEIGDHFLLVLLGA